MNDELATNLRPEVLLPPSADTRASRLIVPSGTTIPLRAGQEYVFAHLEIRAGGRLVLVGGPKAWTKLVSLNAFILAGEIVARGFDTLDIPEETVRDDHDGVRLEHRYLNNNLGGAGGYGAGRVLARASYPRGQGAGPQSHTGGGGGGGIGMEGCRNCLIAPGQNATGRLGGAGGQVSNHRDGGRGGNGAIKGSIDGGLVFIDARGGLMGDGGIIDVRGNPGADGEAGFYAGCGAGGGGGGAPGGHGGKVVIRPVGDLIPPSVLIDPGQGGRGGPGLPGATDWTPPIEHSGPGTSGQEGNPGTVEFVL